MFTKFITTAFLLLLSLGLVAQVFPVDVRQNLVEPFQRLDELARSPQYQVALTLRDPLESGVAVQLRLRMEGQNVLIQTRAGVGVQLHPIEFGQPLVLTGPELAYLFAPENLDVAGRGARDFWRNGGRLEEGFYNVCVEAFLPNRPTELGVSNEGCVPVFVAYDEPPVITYPLDGQHLPAYTPAAFAFTWQNQSTVQMPSYLLEVTPLDGPSGSITVPIGNPDSGTSGGGFGDILGNVTVNGFYPNRQVGNNSPLGNNASPTLPTGNATNAIGPLIFKQDLLQNSYNLLPEDPQMVQGRRYVVRVRAYDPSGQRRFRNEGWSQPVVFTFGIECREVVNVSSLVVADSRVRLSWNIGPGGGNEQGFTVGILNENNPFASWYNISTTLPTLLLDRLEPASRYRFRIRANCDGGISAWTEGNFTTPAGPNLGGDTTADATDEGNTTAAASPTTPGEFVVGDSGEPYQPQIEGCSPNASQGNLSTNPKDPTQTIRVNDQFEFAGFPVRAVTVEGGVPTFSGKGTLLIPWLEQGAISIRYTGVSLDADRRAISGTISPKRGKKKFDATKFSASLGNDEECANYQETQLDDRGFDDAGVHYLTGTPLDPYGFDATGRYHGTTLNPNGGTPRDPRGFDANGLQEDGTAYDSNGCNRDSLNVYGQPCVWRTGSTTASTEEATANNGSGGNAANAGAPGDQNQTGGTSGATTNNAITPSGSSAAGAPTIEGTAYTTTLGDSLIRVLTRQAVDSMLARLATQSTRSREAQQLAALAVSAYISLTGLERELLVGADDVLLKDGMSRLYPNGMPQPDSLRDLKYWAYDQAIRAVYRLDKYVLDTITPLETIYRNHQANPKLGQLADHVKQHFNGVSASQVTAFQANPSARFTFVRERVAIKIFELFGDPGAGYSEWQNPERARSQVQWMAATALASTDALWPGATLSVADPRETLRELGVISYDPLLGFELPIKIEKEFAGDKYTIWIDDLAFGTQGSVTADIFTVLPVPGKDGEYVAFKATGVGFSAEGFVGPTKLQLVSKLDVGLGTYGTMTFPANSDNYVEFDCDGYKSFSLEGEVLFCRDKLIPLNQDGTLNETTDAQGNLPRVKANFALQGEKWLDFTLGLTTDQLFAVKGLREVWWTARDINLDFSETESPEVTFPEGYQHAFAEGDKPGPKWQGIHIGQLDATLDIVEKRNDGEKLKIATERLVIDDTGLSVKAEATNLLTTQEGRMGKWAFSVDTVGLELRQSSLVTARVTGDVVLPTEDQDKLGYLAQASEDKGFLFSVSLEQDKVVDWDGWDGQLTIAKNSALEIGKIASNQQWGVRTKLYGKLELGVKETSKFKVPDIVFEDFRLASFAPYLDLGPTGRFGIQDARVSLAGFSIEVRRLALVKEFTNNEDRFGIDVAGKLSLMGSSGGFGASSGVTLYGKPELSGDLLRFAYDELKVNDIFLNVKIPGVQVAGGIRFFKKGDALNPNGQFGDGFQGLLAARFDGVPVGVAAAGMFGSVDDYRYWFVDAAVQLPIGSASIPLVGVLHCTGLGGGASWHMRRSDNPDEPVTIDFSNIPDELPPLGQTLSGISMAPDKNVGLGLRLMTSIATFPTPAVMNGSLLLGGEFTSSWGLNRLYFAGNAAFMQPTDPKGLPIKGTDPFFALAFNVDYLHRTRTLSGGLYTWLNYGPGVITGGGGTKYGRDKFLGQVEIMASPTTTYTWVGTPQNRFNVRLAPIGLTIGTYFDFGNLLPPPPTLPQGFSRPRMGITGASSGFMHGTEARFGYDSNGKPKKFNFGVGHVSATALAGYNILLTNQLRCQGRSDFGLNKWYLQGNAYGNVKVEGELFGFGFGPFGLNAYASLQTPNPTYIAGDVTINLPANLTYDFAFTFGQSCTFYTVPPDPLETELSLPFTELIVGVNPAGGTDFSVLEPVTINLAAELRQEIVVPQGNQQRKFRLNYEENEVRVVLGNQPSGSAVQPSGDLLRIKPPAGGWRAEETYVLEATVHLEEFTNGQWQDFRQSGQRFEHVVEVEFGTGLPPNLGILAGFTPTNGAANVVTDINLFVRNNYQKYQAFLNENLGGAYAASGTITATLKAADGTDISLTQGGERFSHSPGPGGYGPGFPLTPMVVLAGETEYTLTVTYRANYRQNGLKPLLIGGEQYEETRTITFTTDKLITTLTPAEVTSSYPGPMMYNTYRDQRNGICYADLGDSEGRFGSGWMNPATQELVVYYLDNVSRDTVAKVAGRLAEGQLQWPTLPTLLGLDKTYELQVRLAPKGTIPNGGGNEVSLSFPDRNATPRPASAFPNGHLVYHNWFRTSLYPTFTDKVSNLGWAETQRVDRTGTLSPIYGTDSVKTNYGFWQDHPYVEDNTVRNLGYAGYREAVGLQEPFSDLEVAGSVGVEIQSSNYISNLVDNFFNWSTQVTLPGCAADGSLGNGGTIVINDQLDISQIYLRQGVQAPQLTQRSGHGEGENALLANPNTVILTDPSQPAVTIAQMQAGDIPPKPAVSYGGQVTLPAPLVLVNNLHPASVAQYNYSWAFRGASRIPPCDPPNLTDDPTLDQELEVTPNPGELAEIIDEVNDAIQGAVIAEQLGMGPNNGVLAGGSGGLTPGDGINPGGQPTGTPTTLPGNGGQTGTGLGVGNGQGTVILNNGAYGTQVSAQFNGQPVYNTTNFASGSNNFGPTSMNEGMVNGMPGPGFSVKEPYERQIRRLLAFTQNYMPQPIPDPRGQRVTVRLRYELTNHEGRKETYLSLPIDVTIN